jgi:hypothetical protein
VDELRQDAKAKGIQQMPLSEISRAMTRRASNGEEENGP